MQEALAIATELDVAPQEHYDAVKERFRKLGLATLVQKVDVERKLAIAYAKYGFVTQEAILKFNVDLRKKTATDYGRTYKELFFTRLAAYTEVPPAEVLSKLEGAIADGIFDDFEIARIQEVKRIDPDPILFGRINGSSDYFFIAQWDDDVTIEDIIAAQEE